MTAAVHAKKCRVEANFHNFASAAFNGSNNQHVQCCAGVSEGAAMEGCIENLDPCLLELGYGLLLNITELHSISRISHTSCTISNENSGHAYTCVHTDLKPYAMKCTWFA